MYYKCLAKKCTNKSVKYYNSFIQCPLLDVGPSSSRTVLTRPTSRQLIIQHWAGGDVVPVPSSIIVADRAHIIFCQAEAML